MVNNFESIGVHWPPAGWKRLRHITRPKGHAITKDPENGTVRGLSYRIDSVPLYHKNTLYFIHTIQIDGWDYNIHNDSQEYPVLSFNVRDRFDLRTRAESCVSDIESLSCPVAFCKPAVRRAVRAALCFIGHIDKGQVPDTHQILKDYGLHPSQIRVYETGPFVRTDFRRGAAAGEMEEFLWV